MIKIGDRVKYIGNDIAEISELNEIDSDTYNVLDIWRDLFKIGNKNKNVRIWRSHIKKVSKKVKRLN